MINLAGLPDIAFCETNTAAVEAALIADFELITSETLFPGDPKRLFVEALAYLIAQQRFQIDFAGKQNLLSYAGGGYLDHVAALLSTARLGDSPASTTLRFSLAAALAWPLTIPAGIRASSDGSLMFATDSDLLIPTGDVAGEVGATCQLAGTLGNGLVPGQINRLVDSITYVAGVENISLTLGGTDAESDERLRGRVQLAPEAFSTCGPQAAYRYWAMSVSPGIKDVAVWSPEPGQVCLAPLMAGGELPSSEIINLVGAAVLDTKRRPLTDTVSVVPPSPIEFSVAGTYYVRTSSAHLAGSIQAKAANDLAGYVAWQSERLGRDITPSELVGRIQGIDGVQRVELSSPAYQALDPWQIAAAASAELLYGGLSDD